MVPGSRRIGDVDVRESLQLTLHCLVQPSWWNSQVPWWLKSDYRRQHTFLWKVLLMKLSPSYSLSTERTLIARMSCEDCSLFGYWAALGLVECPPAPYSPLSSQPGPLALDDHIFSFRCPTKRTHLVDHTLSFRFPSYIYLIFCFQSCATLWTHGGQA